MLISSWVSSPPFSCHCFISIKRFLSFFLSIIFISFNSLWSSSLTSCWFGEMRPDICLRQTWPQSQRTPFFPAQNLEEKKTDIVLNPIKHIWLKLSWNLFRVFCPLFYQIISVLFKPLKTPQKHKNLSYLIVFSFLLSYFSFFLPFIIIIAESQCNLTVPFQPWSTCHSSIRRRRFPTSN